MPYPSRPLYVTWGGKIGAGSSSEDVWQCGLHLGLASTAQPDMPNLAGLESLYDEVIAPYHADNDIKVSAGAVLQWAKAVVLTETGSYAGEPLVANGSDVGGGVSSPYGAPQLSLAITLQSGQSLGKGNYGRYYLPWFAEPAAITNGRLPVAARDAVCVRSAEFLESFDAWGTGSAGGAQVMIFGKTGAGTKKVPVLLKVGDVIDTQRRRRNRIQEAYTAIGV